MMKRLGIVLLATVGLASLAQAADLPSKKEAAPAPKPNCWAGLWTWLNTSADDCPIGAYGITLYGNLDLNVGYQEWGTQWNGNADKQNYLLAKSSYEHLLAAGYNGISTSVIGLKMKESLAPLGLPDWSLVGVLEAGVSPFTGVFYNNGKGLTDNNLRAANGIQTITIGKNKYTLYNDWQNSSADSSRMGQWDNSQGYIGLSHKVWGVLTFGRTNNLLNDTLGKYDPIGGGNAFSLIGNSGSFPGVGNTQIARINTALTYKVAIPNVWTLSTVRLAGQAQLGGYGVGNGSMAAYWGQAGFDYGNFSLDGILGWAKDAVGLSNYGGSVTACGVGYTNISQSYNVWPGSGCYNPNDILKATLSNNFGGSVLASYKWDAFKFYGGYIYARLSNPSDSFVGGFETISSGIFVPPGAVTSTDYLLNNGTLNAPAFAFNKVLQTIWMGVKYSVPSDWMRGWGSLDLAAAFYYQWQNNYNFSWNTGKINGVPYGYATSAACTGTGAFISSSKCDGSQDVIALFADWKPVKRVDIYAGVAIQNVYGGLANGFWNYRTYYNPATKTIATAQHAFTQTYDPTIGIRVRF
jgi:predicted porin